MNNNIYRNLIILDIGTYGIPKANIEEFVIKKFFKKDSLEFETLKIESKRISYDKAKKTYGPLYTLYNKKRDGLPVIGEMNSKNS